MLFSEDSDQPFSQLSYTAPAGTERHIITGLPANAGFAVTVAETAAGMAVTILPDGDTPADDAGVLVLPAGHAPAPSCR